MKNISEISSSWEETKRKIRRKFAALLESNTLLEKEKENELIDSLHARLGKTKEEIRKIISEL